MFGSLFYQLYIYINHGTGTVNRAYMKSKSSKNKKTVNKMLKASEKQASFILLENGMFAGWTNVVHTASGLPYLKNW